VAGKLKSLLFWPGEKDWNDLLAWNLRRSFAVKGAHGKSTA
jgi:hypothetical protein